jgi:hypothetical protein
MVRSFGQPGGIGAGREAACAGIHGRIEARRQAAIAPSMRDVRLMAGGAAVISNEADRAENESCEV